MKKALISTALIAFAICSCKKSAICLNSNNGSAGLTSSQVDSTIVSLYIREYGKDVIVPLSVIAFRTEEIFNKTFPIDTAYSTDDFGFEMSSAFQYGLVTGSGYVTSPDVLLDTSMSIEPSVLLNGIIRAVAKLQATDSGYLADANRMLNSVAFNADVELRRNGFQERLNTTHSNTKIYGTWKDSSGSFEIVSAIGWLSGKLHTNDDRIARKLSWDLTISYLK